MKKKKVKFILAVILLIIIITIIIFLLNPLRYSKEKIREKLLESTPIGTEMQEVFDYINSHNEWEIEYIDYNYGYLILGGKYPSEVVGNLSSEYLEKVIGEQSTRVFLGEYHNPLCVSVVAYYAFDSEGKLINIAVDKHVDGI